MIVTRRKSHIIAYSMDELNEIQIPVMDGELQTLLCGYFSPHLSIFRYFLRLEISNLFLNTFGCVNLGLVDVRRDGGLALVPARHFTLQKSHSKLSYKVVWKCNPRRMMGWLTFKGLRSAWTHI